METLIKKINEIVDEAIKESEQTMDDNLRDLSHKGTLTFYKAKGRNQLANEIKLLIIKEGGIL